GAVGAGPGVLGLVREKVGLGELHDAHRPQKSDPRRDVNRNSLLKQGEPLVDPARQRQHLTQMRYHDRTVERDAPVPGLYERSPEQPLGRAQLRPNAVEVRETQTRPDEAERVVERFGDPDGFLSVGVTLIEHPSLGEHARQDRPRYDGGEHREPEPLTEALTREQLYEAPAMVFGPAIVPCVAARQEKAVLRSDSEPQIGERLAEALAPPSHGPRLGRVPTLPHGMGPHVTRHPS